MGTIIGGSSTGQLRMLQVGQLVAFPLLTLLFASIYMGGGVTGKLMELPSPIQAVFPRTLCFIAASYVIFIMPASKGFMLGGLASFFLVSIFSKNLLDF
jgi:hypothetical protein